MSENAPQDTLEAAVKHLFASRSDFLWGSQDKNGLPAPDFPEIAFAGRSNVGKSSLINALTGQKTLAITSKTPGRTRQLNFFSLGEKARLVDMPGYGYAKISHAERDIWDDLIVSFLKGRPNLLTVFVLVDSRHGLKDSDKVVLKLLADAAVSARLVLTKADELKPGPQQKAITDLVEATKKYATVHPVPQLVSAHSGFGIDDLRNEIAQLIIATGAFRA